MSSTSITRSGLSRGAASCLAKLRFYSCVLAGSPICLLLGAPLVRATWDEVNEIIAAANAYTVKTYGPDRVIGFSPIPAMSMVSYAAGSRYLSLLGCVCMSFYDWYCDLPPASPMTRGEQTDVPESADWYNAGFLMLWGSNVPQTRTPDAHFYTEVRYKGTKSVVVSPDYAYGRDLITDRDLDIEAVERLGVGTDRTKV